MILMSDTAVHAEDLFNTVVPNGMCIGCGACAAFDPGIDVRLDESGRYIAVSSSADFSASSVANRVCPFSNASLDENELSSSLFGDSTPYDSYAGSYLASYAGWVAEGDYRSTGSSGGLVSWLLVELLEQDLVDYVVHVAPRESIESEQPLFNYVIATTASDVRRGPKSQYYPVEMSGVIGEIISRPGRYAVVGIPCFVKALRLAARESALLNERLTFAVGLVCGHLKSTAFAELAGWESGILPTDLESIDFRTKLPDRSASSYGVTVSGSRAGESVTVTRPSAELYGSNWGHGLFKYKACDFCDDVVGETADISIGDAWLKEYEWDSEGTNIVVVRTDSMKAVIDGAVRSGRLSLEQIPIEKVQESQAGGFRHRRDGLGYRLLLEDQAGRWRPGKRVEPSDSGLSRKFRRILELRVNIAEKSHIAFQAAKQKQDLPGFFSEMEQLIQPYDRINRSQVRSLLGKIKRAVLFLPRKLRGS